MDYREVAEVVEPQPCHIAYLRTLTDPLEADYIAVHTASQHTLLLVIPKISNELVLQSLFLNSNNTPKVRTKAFNNFKSQHSFERIVSATDDFWGLNFLGNQDLPSTLLIKLLSHSLPIQLVRVISSKLSDDELCSLVLNGGTGPNLQCYLDSIRDPSRIIEMSNIAEDSHLRASLSSYVSANEYL